MSINLIRDLGFSEDDPEIIEAQTIVAFEYFLKDAGMEDADAEASVKNFVRAIRYTTLMQAAHDIERHAHRIDTRLTEHVVFEAGGAALLREYAEEAKNDRA